jgi:serine/threonine protein kinase
MIGKRIGKYRVVRALGEGGMGVVYEALREDIEVRAAIKVLRPEFASNVEVAGRFFNGMRGGSLRRKMALFAAPGNRLGTCCPAAARRGAGRLTSASGFRSAGQ